MCPKDADRMANSVDPDQTAPVWVYTVCSDRSCLSITVDTVGFFKTKPKFTTMFLNTTDSFMK